MEESDFMDCVGSRVDIDVDTIPDSDTREDDLAYIIDYKTFNNRRINYGEY